MRVLVIDARDGEHVRSVLQAHSVTVVTSAADALETLPLAEPRLVILDPQLPDMSGLLLLPKIAPLPVIVLSASDDLATRVLALRAGADDYISKPFDPDELAERVARVLWRSYPSEHGGNQSITLGTLVIEYGDVRVDGVRLDLTRTEENMLTGLARQPGVVLTYGEVIAAMYGSEDAGDLRGVQTHLARLRQKLTGAGVVDVTIRTVRERGLVLDYMASG